MNIHFQDLIPGQFADDSRVWIYQSNRQFNNEEAMQVEEQLDAFTSSWKSHGAVVKGAARLLFGQFIVLLADESATGVSGCSTDGSVRLIKNIELDLNVRLFDRQTLAFITQQRIQLIPLKQLNTALENGLINPDTLYFNNTVQTKKELTEMWIIPANQSWLNKKIMLPS